MPPAAGDRQIINSDDTSSDPDNPDPITGSCDNEPALLVTISSDSEEIDRPTATVCKVIL